MKNKEEFVKLGIVSSLFIVFGIIVACVFYFRNDSKNLESRLPYEMQEVLNYSEFFSVVNNINQYIFYNGSQNSNAIYNVLAKEYILKNNIDIHNLYSKVLKYNENENIKVKNMYYLNYGANTLYYVKGDIISNLFEQNVVRMENTRFFVFIDYNNLTFAIYPIDENEGEEVLPFSLESIQILKNDSNQMLSSGLVNDDYICNLYLADYMDLVLSDTQKSYDLLEDNFKKQNFDDEKTYASYIQNKIENLSLEITDCNMKTNAQQQKEYYVKIMDNFSITFIEDSIMNYKVKFVMN